MILNSATIPLSLENLKINQTAVWTALPRKSLWLSAILPGYLPDTEYLLGLCGLLKLR